MFDYVEFESDVFITNILVQYNNLIQIYGLPKNEYSIEYASAKSQKK